VTARILEVDAEAYHALDLFSPSVATTLINRSPLHAMAMSGKPPSKLMDRGSLMHRLILGDGKDFAVLDYDDWRTKDARADRDAARAKGKVPVLKHEHDGAQKAAIAILSRLRSMGVRLDGKSEAAIEWEESTAHGPVKCKTMVDHLRLDAGEMLELKIVDDASPSRSERSAENMGHAIACAARTRALTALRPNLAGRTRYRFLFCEAEPPYAIYAPQPDGVFRELGEQRWLRAVQAWGKCQATGHWPAYEEHNSITSPPWALAREGFTTDER
jgi:hypothetical protein